MEFGAISHVGRIREINEDSFYVPEKNIQLYMVADGMGGHNAGEVASKLAIEVVKKYIENRIEISSNNDEEICGMIKQAIFEANQIILQQASQEISCQGMGTTLTLVYIQSKAYIGHVGDSRAYLLKRKDITQITQDHSLVAELVKNGTITKTEARSHPQRNVITRALGTDSDIEVDLSIIDLDESDLIVLCSDGLSNLVEEGEIKDCFESSNNLQQCCEHLVNLANERGGQDNITIIAVKN